MCTSRVAIVITKFPTSCSSWRSRQLAGDPVGDSLGDLLGGLLVGLLGVLLWDL